MTDDIVARLRGYIPALNAKEVPQAFVDMKEAAYEIERLRELVRFKSAQIDSIRNAVENKGPQPKYHDSIHKKHMKEWPTLWKAIYSSWEELAQRPYYDG
jgi:hypothetical protein